MITFFNKFFSILILIFCCFSTLNGILASAQNINDTKSWDESSSETRISSPIADQIEVDQSFYLRYIQNIQSFNVTSKITWQIENQNSKIIYTRSIDFNQDKNEVVKISEPCSYNINLNLKIGTNEIKTSKKLQIIPKDKDYYQGLQLNEISFSQSKVEIYNSSSKDIDTSALFLDYNSNSDQKKLSDIKTIPSQSFAVFNLSSKLDFAKISLVFEKNIKQKNTSIISEFEKLDSIVQSKLTDPSLSLQYSNENNDWLIAANTFGQKNQLKIDGMQESYITANFQQVETARTGGQDFNPIVLFSFSLFMIVLLLNHIDELAFEKIRKILNNFKYPSKQIRADLTNFFKTPFAYIITNCNTLKSELHFYFWTRLALLKTI